MALVSRLSRTLRPLCALAAGLALAGFAQAQIVYFQCTINGANEVPPTPSNGTGLGCFSFDTSTNIISYNITFSNLLGPETLAHFHQAPPGTNGGIIVNLPLGSPKIGTAALTAAQASQLLAGNIYTNIHTTVFPGGEVRGQLTPMVPTTLLCFGDGSSGACPCGNQSIVGNNEGCLHNGGVGGRLTATGGTSITCDTLQLNASQMLGQTCIFLQGSTVPFGPTNFGDGLRCIGGTLRRLAVVPIVGGAASLGGGSGTPIHISGLVTPGDRGYQVWFRDSNFSFCTALTYNITNGVKATWAP
jgi:hypothetical protein